MRLLFTFLFMVCLHLVGGYQRSFACVPSGKNFREEPRAAQVTPDRTSESQPFVLTKTAELPGEYDPLFIEEEDNEEESFSRKHKYPQTYSSAFFSPGETNFTQVTHILPLKNQHSFQHSYHFSCKYLEQRVLRI